MSGSVQFIFIFIGSGSVNLSSPKNDALVEISRTMLNYFIVDIKKLLVLKNQTCIYNSKYV